MATTADEFLNQSINASKIKPDSASNEKHIVTPGEAITNDSQFMRSVSLDYIEHCSFHLKKLKCFCIVVTGRT
jgi:hypothetical protein